MTKIQEILRTNVKRARKELGYSQMKLAELCGMSTSFLGEIELGRKFPSAQSLQRLADALGLRPFQLFLEEEDWATFEKYNVLTNLFRELRQRLDEEVTETFQKYISQK
ncbi:MAG TPA: helix-turn-helix transcriptional regulator [Spirochaetia bacterium]|nr:helix-turn-helix transcriptional regulator [Spirochaetia bacterium]